MLKKMKTILIALTSFILILHSIDAKKDQCKTCNDLIDNFIKGFKKTSKGNFGGGNTDWEDRKLGSYITSDIRFEEIVENICSDKENQCHQLLEEQEDNLLKVFKTDQKTLETGLFDKICINSAKACCPKSTFGKECQKCPLCNGNGLCDGEGTRDGTGKCNCNLGYAGESCSSCNIGYYEEYKNESGLKCSECYRACQTCTGPDVNSCLSCKTGWTFNSESKLCEDVDECLNEKTCRSKEYCQNTEGSHSCLDCNPACADGCTGPGPEKCIGKCNKGYEKSTEGCVDINECEQTPGICSNENYECINKPGSYECRATTETTKVPPSNSDNDDDQDDLNDEL